MIENGISLLTDKEKFEKQLNVTNEQTGYSRVLLEKDFYLTLILQEIAKQSLPLVFKGGTSLNKCHLGFYRLSEDLDFDYAFQNLPNRSERSKQFDDLEKRLQDIASKIPGLEKKEISKFNQSRQLKLVYEYSSIYNGSSEIKFDISFKDALLTKTEEMTIQHSFKHPITDALIIPDDMPIKCMSLKEVVSEKIRACLTRKVPAIRDYFDIWYLWKIHQFDFSDHRLHSLVRTKLKQSNGVLYKDSHKELLKSQIRAELKPTLVKDYGFDLDSVCGFLEGYSMPYSKEAQVFKKMDEISNSKKKEVDKDMYIPRLS